MNEIPESNQKKKKGNEDSGDVYEWLQCIIPALVFCILVFVFIARPLYVIGSSMLPTLEENDRLVICKLFYEPERGDIVVLRKESFSEKSIVKRVIATEGETVDIDFEAGVVYVDGTALDEPYTNSPTNDPEEFTEPVTVPEGCVFVMGDNRNRSTDSRTGSIGCVDTRYIVGKAIFRLTPISKFGKIE